MLPGTIRGMCNLYSITKGQQAIRELYRAAIDRSGNLRSMRGVFRTTRRRSCATGRTAASW